MNGKTQNETEPLIGIEGNGGGRLWAQEEIDYLLNFYPLDGQPPRSSDPELGELSRLFDRTPAAISTKWYDLLEKKLGISYTEAKRRAKFPRAYRPYSEEEEKAIVNAFPLWGEPPKGKAAKALAGVLGRPVAGVIRHWYHLAEIRSAVPEADEPEAKASPEPTSRVRCPHCGGGFLIMDGRIYMEVTNAQT